MLSQFWIDVRVRLVALLARRRVYARADEELQFYLAMREQFYGSVARWPESQFWKRRASGSG